MPIRNVIFDFGGVLVRWKPLEIIEGFYGDVQLREQLARSVFRHSDWTELDRGSLSEEEAVERFADRMGRPPEEMRMLLGVVKESLTPLEESFSMARQLAERGYQLYGLSNISVPMFAHLRARYDHWRIFRGIVISGEIGLVKPDRKIFEHLCRRYHLEPTESIFIDDHLPNIDAACKLGFHVIFFESRAQCLHELTILTSDNGPR
jgi:putative hydrolase of the HAD superfamily